MKNTNDVFQWISSSFSVPFSFWVLTSSTKKICVIQFCWLKKKEVLFWKFKSKSKKENGELLLGKLGK